MTRELGDRMVSDPRFKLLTFTGSPSVGWRMKERAGKKKVVLELGGNAGRDHRRDGRRRLGRQAHPRRRLQLCRPVVHQRPADLRPRGRRRRLPREAPRRRRGCSRSATRSTRRPTSGRWSTTPNAAACPALGRRGRRRWAARCSPAARPIGAYFEPTVLDDVPADGRRSAATRRSPRSSSCSTFSDFGDGDRAGQRQLRSGSRPASSRTTSATPGRRSTSSRSAASS